MHDWRFFSAGGFSQAGLERGADLAQLRELDQKLWVALACPVDGVEFDPATLALLDAELAPLAEGGPREQAVCYLGTIMRSRGALEMVRALTLLPGVTLPASTCDSKRKGRTQKNTKNQVTENRTMAAVMVILAPILPGSR